MTEGDAVTARLSRIERRLRLQAGVARFALPFLCGLAVTLGLLLVPWFPAGYGAPIAAAITGIGALVGAALAMAAWMSKNASGAAYLDRTYGLGVLLRTGRELVTTTHPFRAVVLRQAATRLEEIPLDGGVRLDPFVTSPPTLWLAVACAALLPVVLLRGEAEPSDTGTPSGVSPEWGRPGGPPPHGGESLDGEVASLEPPVPQTWAVETVERATRALENRTDESGAAAAAGADGAGLARALAALSGSPDVQPILDRYYDALARAGGTDLAPGATADRNGGLSTGAPRVPGESGPPARYRDVVRRYFAPPE